MTNYLERLKAKGEGKHIPEAPSKGSKAPFEGFEGDHERGFRRRSCSLHAGDADGESCEMQHVEAMTRRALDLLGSGRNDRYDAALGEALDPNKLASGSAAMRSTSTASSDGRCPCCCASRTCEGTVAG